MADPKPGHRVIVFAGPTLPRKPDAIWRSLLAACDLRPPAQRGDVLTALVQQNNVDPKNYGLTMLPLDAGNSDAGVLVGGNVAAVSPKSSQAQKEAAVKWIDFYYMQKLLNKEQAILGSRYVTRSEVLESLDLVARGEVFPLVSVVRPLEEAEAVHELVERGDVIGRAALRVA